MQHIMNEDEIMDALKAYITQQVIIKPGSEIKIELTMGRTPAGPRATIDIIKTDDASEKLGDAFATPKEAVEEIDEIVETVAKEETHKPTPPKPKPKAKKKPASKKDPEPKEEDPDDPFKAGEAGKPEDKPEEPAVDAKLQGDSLFSF